MVEDTKLLAESQVNSSELSSTSQAIVADARARMASRRERFRRNLESALSEILQLSRREKKALRYQVKVRAMELPEAAR